MLHSLNDYDEKIKQFIIKSYHLGQSLEDLEKITGIKRNILITIIKSEDLTDVKKSELPSFSTDTDKILVVADTHIGSIYENWAYINEAYEFGVKEGVGACIHLGDIIQGIYDKTAYPTDKQMEALETKYPTPSEFDTYLIMGNHDYGVFNNSEVYMKILESKKGLNVLGYKKAYFEWAKYLFSMEHKIKQLDVFVPEYESLLTLVGHGHELKIKSNQRVKAPTLSDDIMAHAQGQVPGFLVLEREDKGIVVDSYCFDDNDKPKIKTKGFYKRNYRPEYKVK